MEKSLGSIWHRFSRPKNSVSPTYDRGYIEAKVFPKLIEMSKIIEVNPLFTPLPNGIEHFLGCNFTKDDFTVTVSMFKKISEIIVKPTPEKPEKKGDDSLAGIAKRLSDLKDHDYDKKEGKIVLYTKEKGWADIDIPEEIFTLLGESMETLSQEFLVAYQEFRSVLPAKKESLRQQSEEGLQRIAEEKATTRLALRIVMIRRNLAALELLPPTLENQTKTESLTEELEELKQGLLGTGGIVGKAFGGQEVSS